MDYYAMIRDHDKVIDQLFGDSPTPKNPKEVKLVSTTVPVENQPQEKKVVCNRFSSSLSLYLSFSV